MAPNFYRILVVLLFLSGSFLAQAQDTLTIRIERGCHSERTKVQDSYYGYDLSDSSWVMSQDVDARKPPELGDTLILRVEQVPKDSTIFCSIRAILPNGVPMDEPVKRYYRVKHPIGQTRGILVPYWEGIYPDSTRARLQRQQQNR